MAESSPEATPHADQPLRIVVADTPALCAAYQEWLPSLGHQLAGIAYTGRELVECCAKVRPDLIITEIYLPGLDAIAASVEINRDLAFQVPFILVSDRQDAEVLERFGVDHIMAYLSKPVKPVDLAAAIHLALIRFRHYQQAARQAHDLGQALGDRKLIERAKGVIMRQAQVNEEEAFRRLQKMATARNQKLVEVAKGILVADEAFRLQKD